LKAQEVIESERKGVKKKNVKYRTDGWGFRGKKLKVRERFWSYESDTRVMRRGLGIRK